MKEQFNYDVHSINGFKMEKGESFREIMSPIPGYGIIKASGKIGTDIYFKGEPVATGYKLRDFHTILAKSNTTWPELLSGKDLSARTILILVENDLYIIESLCNRPAEYVFKQLQICGYKKSLYFRLVKKFEYSVDRVLKLNYYHILNKNFEETKYADVFYYVQMADCKYKFNKLMVDYLNLPIDYGLYSNKPGYVPPPSLVFFPPTPPSP